MIKSPIPGLFITLSLFTACCVLTVGLTSIFLNFQVVSGPLYQITKKIDSRFFLQLLDEEFPGIFPRKEKENTASLFEKLLGVQWKNPMTLVSKEIPGLEGSIKSTKVAHLPPDPSSNPAEDNPIINDGEEVDTSIAEWAQKESDALIPAEVPQWGKTAVPTVNGKATAVFVYHTHNRESFMSEVEGAKSWNDAFHPTRNITLVGKHFAEELERNNIAVHYDNTDYQTILDQRNLKYPHSYAVSLETVTAMMTSNPEIDYIFDFHRDAQGRDKTTVTIDGVEYAQVMFVIGQGNKNWKSNLAFAKKLKEILDQKYPGLCREIVEYEKSSQRSGEYNQSVSPRALTVEIGGVENTLDEAKRTAELLAEAFTEIYLDAVPVFQFGNGGS